MPNIHELLGINPTDNFEIVKEQFCLKREELHKSYLAESDLEKSCLILDQYGCLIAAYERYKSSTIVSVFIHVPYDELFIDKFRKKRNGVFEVDSDLFELERLPKGKTNLELQQHFTQTFDFTALANHLSRRSHKGPFQVGLTHQEGLDIANLHSHYYYGLIVEVTLSLKLLSESRALELHNRYSNFFWLTEKTHITGNQIKAVRPILGGEYLNTRRMIEYDRTHPYLLWPSNLAVLHNTNYVHQTEEAQPDYSIALRWSS